MCETHAELSTFSQKVRRQIKRGYPAVCQACEKRGFSALDTARYKCSRCGRVCGHLLFNAQQLDNNKRCDRLDPLTCLDCRARENCITKKLNTPGAWRCTCVQRPGHSDKCNLYPTRMGERRWPGKNKGVEEEDWLFVEPVWKRRRVSLL